MIGSSTLSFLAVVFVVVAGWFGYSAFAMSTSVFVEGAPVANLELMHYQSQNLAICIGSLIIAAILISAAAIIEAFNGRSHVE